MNETLNLIKAKLKELNFYDSELSELLNTLNQKADLYINIEKCLYDTELYLIYKHTDPNGKVYIGITQNHPQTRWHNGQGYEKQTKFYRAIQKYGWINFKHEIIAAGLSEEDAKSLENKLIIETKAYDQNFGYNTKIFKSETAKHTNSDKSTTSKTKPQNNNRHTTEKNSVDISKELIDKYNLMFIIDTIYYRKNGVLFSETENPILNKVLLDEYNIPLRKHTEILEQVKILCATDKNILSQTESQQILTKTNSILKWIEINNLEANDMINRPSCDWYNTYAQWAKTRKIKDVKGKKQFYKFITEHFHFSKKQKSDGKRYFCIID